MNPGDTVQAGATGGDIPEMPPDHSTNDNSNLIEVFDTIAEKIIAQQELVIGPLAVDQAKKVPELSIDWPKHTVDISGNPQAAIDDLVEQYKILFGQIAVQTCKDAVARYLSQIPPEQQPRSLQ